MRQRERIDAIAGLAIGSIQQALLALVVLSKKPAVRLDIESYKGVNPETFLENLNKIFEYVFIDHLDSRKDEWKRTAVYYVSDSGMRAKMLKETTMARDRNLFIEEEIPPEVHILYGTMLGYPDTAIDGYVKNKLLPVQDYPDEFKDNLFAFQLSQENWEKEVQIAMGWLELLHEEAPKIANLSRGRFSSIEIAIKSRGFEEG